MINFARGHPNSSLLPLDAMKVALDLVKDKGLLQSYLNYPKRDDGSAELLHELSSFLNRHCQTDDCGILEDNSQSSIEHKICDNCTPGDQGSLPQPNSFFMTHGVSHAIDILCGALTKANDLVLMEVPTYFLVAGIFESHGLRLEPLPMKKVRFQVQTNGGEEMALAGDLQDRDGIILDVAQLEYNLDHHLQEIPKMMYIIPTHHNPTGSTLPVEDRISLARLARRYGIIVVADEVYHLLDWRHISLSQDSNKGMPRMKRHPARMAVISAKINCREKSTKDATVLEDPNDEAKSQPRQSTGKGYCISVSSFTKIFCPGIRCGWIEGPSSTINSICQYGYIRSQGGCVPLVGEIARCALSSGLVDQTLQSLQVTLHQRSELLHNLLIANGIIVCTKPLGGYFLWVELPVEAVGFAAYCEERGVKIMPGRSCDPFASHKKKSNDEDELDLVSCSARLCFADLSLNDLEDGAAQLGELLREYQKIAGFAKTNLL